MSVIAGVARAAGAKVLTGRPARKVLPTTKGTLVVMALALLALATLISASKTVNVGHSPAASTNSEAAAAPVSQPAAAPQMSEEAAIDAYGKLPLSFIPNEGQMKEEAVRYYAQGAGYGFFFTKGGATLSFAEGKGRGGHALALDFLGADPGARSPRAALGEGQLPSKGRADQVAPGAAHPRRAPLRGAVAWYRHGRARGGGQSQVRVPPQAWLIGRGGAAGLPRGRGAFGRGWW